VSFQYVTDICKVVSFRQLFHISPYRMPIIIIIISSYAMEMTRAKRQLENIGDCKNGD